MTIYAERTAVTDSAKRVLRASEFGDLKNTLCAQVSDQWPGVLELLSSGLESDDDCWPSVEALFAAMQQAVPPGLDTLTGWEADCLRVLTQALVVSRGEVAALEHSRYVDTQQRRLELSERKLREHISGKTILVTGGTGLVGSCLIAELQRYAPAHIVSISRGVSVPRALFAGVHYRCVDIRDRSRICEVFLDERPDIVYHVAADKYNHEAESRVHHTLGTNVLGTENVIAAGEASGATHLVYASTGKACRPFSPDVYASSKKTSEHLVARCAARNKLICSAARFTHVVDDSNIQRRIDTWVKDGQPVMLQGPEVWFYIQSAQESAQLMLNAGLEGKRGAFNVQAIRDLGLPINLADLGIGAIAKQQACVPIYFRGTLEGHEDGAWPFLYGSEAGDYSPLINSLDTGVTAASVSCPAIDSFCGLIAQSDCVEECYAALRAACLNNASVDELRCANQALSWAIFDSRLKLVDKATLTRLTRRIQQHPGGLFCDHDLATNQALVAACEARHVATALGECGVDESSGLAV
jgi:hypothetical protein